MIRRTGAMVGFGEYRPPGRDFVLTGQGKQTITPFRVLNQGNTNSCVGHAIRGALGSVGIEDVSEWDIWRKGKGRSKQKGDAGCFARHAINETMLTGWCPEQDYVKEDALADTRLKGPVQLASRRRLRERPLTVEYLDNFFMPWDKIFDAVKRNLEAGMPLVFSMPVEEPFFALATMDPWKPGKGKTLGYHCMYAYSATSEGLICRNSYGEHGFGVHGDFHLDKRSLGHQIKEGPPVISGMFFVK